MTHVTPEDLLLFLYNEASPELMEKIKNALEGDWTLREKLAVLKAAGDRLQTVVQAPRTESVLKILQYAAATETAPHK